jgi:hypothetical protein
MSGTSGKMVWEDPESGLRVGVINGGFWKNRSCPRGHDLRPGVWYFVLEQKSGDVFASPPAGFLCDKEEVVSFILQLSKKAGNGPYVTAASRCRDALSAVPTP